MSRPSSACSDATTEDSVQTALDIRPTPNPIPIADKVSAVDKRYLIKFMGDRSIRSVLPRPWQSVPAWVFLSLAANAFFLAVVMLVALRDYSLSVTATTPIPTAQARMLSALSAPSPELGPRHQLTYQQWVDLLEQEAKATAERHPQHLAILAGDSLSLWFPPELLPTDHIWLNQGISGETSSGLLKRLNLFEQTQPTSIFVMIGINDLIRQVNDQTLLANQQQILHSLRQQHPNAQIVLQSILPHGGEQATWEGRDRLLTISNDHIRELNQTLAAIAHSEGVYYLDLHPLFTDAQGNLRSDFSTDGLHLNPQGYLVWRTALQMYSRMELGETSH